MKELANTSPNTDSSAACFPAFPPTHHHLTKAAGLIARLLPAAASQYHISEAPATLVPSHAPTTPKPRFHRLYRVCQLVNRCLNISCRYDPNLDPYPLGARRGSYKQHDDIFIDCVTEASTTRAIPENTSNVVGALRTMIDQIGTDWYESV